MMAGTNEPCCGHEHYDPDELWLSEDDVIDLVRSTVYDMLRVPEDKRAGADAAEHDRIRADYERRRADRAGREAPRRLTGRERLQRAMFGGE